MNAALQLFQWAASVIVLAEALNKLVRTAPNAPGLATRQRLVAWLKAVAWALLAMGGFGTFVSPLIQIPTAIKAVLDACVLAGFAVLIVRTRVKEG